MGDDAFEAGILHVSVVNNIVCLVLSTFMAINEGGLLCNERKFICLEQADNLDIIEVQGNRHACFTADKIKARIVFRNLSVIKNIVTVITVKEDIDLKPGEIHVMEDRADGMLAKGNGFSNELLSFTVLNEGMMVMMHWEQEF